MASENPIQMMAHYKSSIIQMVPYFMREENKENSDDYEPNVVSLGPYHHGKEKLRFVEEYFKPMAVEMVVGDSGVGEHDCMNVILGKIGYAKSCYLQEFAGKYSDEEFARMMLRDACVILNYIGPTEGHVLHKKIRMIQHLGAVVYANIGRDMYLLENQVPFQILKTLFCFIYNTHGDIFVENVENFCFKMFFHDRDIEKPNDTNHLGRESLHLLEIFRRVVVTGLDYESTALANRRSSSCCCDINSLISCLGCRTKESSVNSTEWDVFRSVTDLKSKGIYLKASGIKSLKGVRFNPSNNMFQTAYLKLPSCHVKVYTRVFFMNMIAYEFSPYFEMSKDVSAYVRLMKLLVVSTDDVKELREKKIIVNNLGIDDVQVVQLYNVLKTYETFDDDYFFRFVKRDMGEHINNKTKTWMAEIKAQLETNYFNSPWSMIAFAVTIFIICLDFIQTYCAVRTS